MFDASGNPLMCSSCGKRCFTLAEASHVLKVMKRRKGQRQTPTRYYWCNESRSYHITHGRDMDKVKHNYYKRSRK